MTQQEKDQKIYQLYATLGELSVLKKQTQQRMDLIDQQVDQFEAELANVLKQQVEAPKTQEPKNER